MLGARGVCAPLSPGGCFAGRNRVDPRAYVARSEPLRSLEPSVLFRGRSPRDSSEWSAVPTQHSAASQRRQGDGVLERGLFYRASRSYPG